MGETRPFLLLLFEPENEVREHHCFAWSSSYSSEHYASCSGLYLYLVNFGENQRESLGWFHTIRWHRDVTQAFLPNLLQSCKTKSGTESLGSRLASFSCNVGCYTKCDFVWNIQNFKFAVSESEHFSCLKTLLLVCWDNLASSPGLAIV